MAVDRLWFAYLKQSTQAHSDFLEWLAEEKEKIRANYKIVKTWDDTLSLQGEEKALDKILRFTIIDAREERQVADFKRRNEGQPA